MLTYYDFRMEKVLSHCLKLLVKLLPTRLLSPVEIHIQERQGKGFVASVNMEVDTIISLLSKNNLTCCYALDIGANSGEWTKSLKSKAPSARVDMFEPNPFHWKTLNALTLKLPQVGLFEVGLADFEQEADFFADSAGSTMASLQQRDLAHLNLTFQKIATVQIKTLDSHYLESVSRPNVIKVDVEGFEYQVLVGGKELLKSVDLVQFEFGGTALDTRIFFKDFWNLLHEAFSIYRLAPHGLVEISRYSEQDEIFRYSNYFAVKKPKK